MTKKHNEDFDDVAFTESEEESGDALAECQRKLKKVKADLSACQKDRQEYLDGWQRMRADVANMKKMHAESGSRSIQTGKEQILSDIIPVLDSFDMAFRGEAWEKVDEAWRKGIEYIHAQFENALTQHGVIPFGRQGDTFDPLLHEAASEEPTKNPAQDGMIASVLQRGYKVGDRIVRPARVTVFKA